MVIYWGGKRGCSSDRDLICLLWSWELWTSPLYNSFFVSVSHSLKPNNSYILDTKVRKVVKEVDVCSLSLQVYHGRHATERDLKLAAIHEMADMILP